MGTTTVQTPSQAGVFVVRGCTSAAVAGGYAPVWAAPVVELMGSAAPSIGNALPAAVRLRVTGTDVPMTGLPIGTGRGVTTTSTTSTTPGDLSLGGPPS